LYLSQAELLRREGKIREALAALDRGTDAVGELASMRTARAQLLLAQGHEKAALDVLSEGTNLVPPDQRPTLWRALGDLQRRLKDPAAARRSYARWAELDPKTRSPASTSWTWPWPTATRPP
jgi:tetratricopeptide (TPR) repeat protein